MALSVVDLYRDYLPKTNCRECGYPTCLAFAGMVVSSRYPLNKCPHILSDRLEKGTRELDEQYQQGKWLKKDLAQEALSWAKQRAASMEIRDLPERIGGRLVDFRGDTALELPYFNRTVLIAKQGLFDDSGEPLGRWEQVFICNHMAQGGCQDPTGTVKSFKEFPNTVSKIKSMVSGVETPLQKMFAGKTDLLYRACERIGGVDVKELYPSADVAFKLSPLPKVPVYLLFWDEVPEENYDARASVLFDETAVEHLDIESILFLSENVKDRLCEI